MKRQLAIILLVFLAIAGQAQNKIWSEVIVGYANVPVIKVTRVSMYADRTDISLRINLRKGQQIGFVPGTALKTDGKEYTVKDATVIKLGEPYTMPADTQDLVLTFNPIPVNTQKFDFVSPDGLLLLNIRNADYLPTDITDTYWRNESTGDWLTGFTTKHVIYNNKVYDIARQTEKKDAYVLTLNDGTVVQVGRIKKGLRTIAIGNAKPVVCSPITGTALPDYPTKDQRKGFVDNGYNATDSVTIIGWLKDMPEKAWQKGREFEVSIGNILSGKQESAFAKMDSLGRFALKMPLLNTSQAFLDWGRTTKSTILEPGKTYFFLFDFANGQQLWMGDDTRVQNELIRHPHEWPNERIEHEERGKVGAMEFKVRTDSSRAASMAKLEEEMLSHPNLSQRYTDYVKGYYQTAQGESMMQARFAFPNYDLPQEYMDYVGRELWQKAIKPYTLYRDFNFFMRDYLDQINSKHARNSADETMKTVRRLEQQGIVTLTHEEDEALKAYLPMLKELEANLQNVQNSEAIQALVDAFNGNETVKKVYALFERIGEPMKKEMALFALRDELALLDSVGCDSQLRDIYIARNLMRSLDAGRQPLEPALMAFAEQQIQTPAAFAVVKALNDRYLAIQNMDISQMAKLNKGDDVAGMSDGEKMLRKICEPYKGRLILLDIWGTWCGPCKEALSHSQEEYDRLKGYDLVYLYLANRSSDESWKNVIKEYNIVGENVVHYNLPADQQNAIENFLQVHSWPTYKLIDRNGNVLDVNADPRDLEGLARLLDFSSPANRGNGVNKGAKDDQAK